MSNPDQFNQLVVLIREVKPSLGDIHIKSEDKLIDTLGLDSLDVLQLSRKINKHMGRSFELDTWNSSEGTIQAVLDNLNRAE